MSKAINEASRATEGDLDIELVRVGTGRAWGRVCQ